MANWKRHLKMKKEYLHISFKIKFNLISKKKTELEHFWENTWPKGKTNTRFFFFMEKHLKTYKKKKIYKYYPKPLKKNSTIFFKLYKENEKSTTLLKLEFFRYYDKRQKGVKECVSLSNHAFPLFLYDWHHIWSIIEHVLNHVLTFNVSDKYVFFPNLVEKSFADFCFHGVKMLFAPHPHFTKIKY